MEMENMEEPSSNGVVLTWKDVCVSLPAGATGRNSPPRFLLNRVSGYAVPDCLLAIMGPSGCGKSTLLNAIAGRLSTATINTGEILVNGRQQRLSYGNSAYVIQDNTLIGTLTTYESLMYSAHIQLPDSMTAYEKNRRVQNSIREMGLQDCVNTRVGDWHTTGLSGGQKRRLSIAIETLRKRSVVLLDEPTSGLDSAAAYHVVKRLCVLAKAGRTVLVSIHQPSSEVFELFGQLCLLAAGRTVYFGERAKAQEFFDSTGFICPAYRNPSDHFLWVINAEFDEKDYDEELGEKIPSQDRVHSVIKAYSKSEMKQAVISAIHHVTQKPGEYIDKGEGGHVSVWTQIFYLSLRTFTNMRRDIAYFWFRLVLYVVLAICIGTIYLKVGRGADSIEARARLFTFVTTFYTFMGVSSYPSYVEELKVFTRERLNGHYGLGVSVMANVLASLPFIALLAAVPGAIIYPLSGLHPGFTHFLFFEITFFSVLCVQEGLMMAVSSVVTDYLAGMIVGCGFMGLYLLTGGYTRLLRNLPKPVWRYPMSYISFHTWGSRAFYNNDFKGLDFDSGVVGAPPLIGESILENNFGMYISYSKWWPVVVLIGMAVIYRLIFICVMKLREWLPGVINQRRHHGASLERQGSHSGALVAPQEFHDENDK